jgi:glycosyltransferase involved in cell wall biosynthesis
MAIAFVTNYLTPYQAALFSRNADVIITCSSLEARHQWAPLEAQAQVNDVSRLRLTRRLREISSGLSTSINGVLIGGSVRSPEFWFSIALCRSRGIPFAVWMERPRLPVTRLRGKIVRCALGNAGVILAVGTAATIAYRQLIPGVKVRNFPYSYGRNSAAGSRAPDPGSSCRVTTALIIGTEWKRKGLDILLAAATMVPPELQSRLAIRVAGLRVQPPELQSLARMTSSIDVTYLGFLDPHDVRREMGSADVLVVPSRYDGWAVVVEEAMAEGTPVIVSDAVGAAPDLVVDGYSGYVVPSEDRAALAAAVARVMSHDVAGRSLSIGAKAIIDQHRSKYNIESLERAICGQV